MRNAHRPATTLGEKVAVNLNPGGVVAPDDRPYCGVELLPHATFPDGSAAPAVCTLPVHGPGTMHCDGEGTSWRWQDADGAWRVA